MGILNQNLKPVSNVISKEGFTGMIRTIPFHVDDKLFFFNHETYINEDDSLSILKLLNDKLEVLAEK